MKNRITEHSVSRVRRWLPLPRLALAAALATAIAFALGASPAPVSAATGHSSGHYDLLAVATCGGTNGTQVTSLSVSIETESGSEFQAGDWFAVNLSSPQNLLVGFEVEYSSSTCNSVGINFTLSSVTVPGYVEANFGAAPAEFEAEDPNVVLEDGPKTLNGSSPHEDPNWEFTVAGTYTLNFTVSGGTATPQPGQIKFVVTN